MNIRKEKKCIRCGDSLLLAKFCKKAKNKDGYDNKCKECTKRDYNIVLEKLRKKNQQLIDSIK